MTHRKRKLFAIYLDDEHIGTGTFAELEEITTLKRSTLSNIIRLGHKHYRIEHIGTQCLYTGFTMAITTLLTEHSKSWQRKLDTVLKS